ncbi:MAG: arsenate reductase ArsC [Thermoleophilaceae bacterium]|jgi:arsenate reductase|nr:arsenate reductase ArsC [Thermoleophilaceae bacterium]
MRYVLFVCTHNAGRSQMAQAFFERHGPADVRAESAGQEPAAQVWPEVVEAMAEVGIDLADRRPTKLTVEMQLHADWAVTLACGAQCPYVPTTVEDWDIPDPAGRTLEEVRAIRDGVEARVRELIDEKLDLIRSDRTAHQLRTARLLPDLVKEFGDRRTEEEIRMAADAALAEFQDAPVRSYVMTIANRKAREVLRSGGQPAIA